MPISSFDALLPALARNCGRQTGGPGRGGLLGADPQVHGMLQQIDFCAMDYPVSKVKGEVIGDRRGLCRQPASIECTWSGGCNGFQARGGMWSSVCRELP